METREMVCIRCPLGCALTVTKEGEVITVTGNTCPRGEEYAKNELTAPMRTVTSTVRIKGRDKMVVSVKTASDIPKEKVMDCVLALKEIEIEAPVQIGDIVLSNVVGTGVDVVATKGYN